MRKEHQRRDIQSGCARRLGLLSSLALLVCATGNAEEDWLSETDWIADVPKVFFATRHAQSITRAPSSVTIINREMIRAQGADNIAELLRLVPGFQVFASNGSTFGVTPHGFTDRDPRRMEVRVNGRSVFLPLLSSVSWESLGLLPGDVDHIEVVRGSNVPAYGSNAILGAVNIVTRNPVSDTGGEAILTTGSNGIRIVSGRQSIATARSNVLVRGAYRESDGFDGVRDEAYLGHLVLNSVYTPDLSNSIEFELGYSDGQFGVGDGDHLDEFTDEDRRAAWVHTSWQGGSSENLYKLRFSYSDYEYLQNRQQLLSVYYDVPAQTIPLVFPGQVDEAIDVSEGARKFSVLSVEFENHLQTGGPWQGVWGVGGRLDQLDSEHYLDGENVDIGVYYLFGNLEWEASQRLVANAGFMLEDQEGFGNDLSSRVALNYQFNDRHHGRISSTRAYRQPALLETRRVGTLRFSDGTLIDLTEMSDPGIRSERVDAYEIGYIYYSPDRNIDLDVKLFREDVERAIISGFDIDTQNCANPPAIIAHLASKYCQSFYVGGEYGAVVDDRVRVYSNTAEWFVEGAELQFSWRFNDSTWLRVDAALLDYGGKRDRRLNRPSYTAPLTDYLPEKSGGILFSHSWAGGWRIGSYLKYVDLVSWRGGTDVERHTRWDVNIGKLWNLSDSNIELNLKIQNLARDTYLEFQQNNEFGRRAFVSLNYRWR